MRRLIPTLFLLGACARAVTGPSVAIAPPTGSVPMVAATGTDVRVESAMSIAWEHPTSFKPWVAAGDAIVALSQNGNEIDVVDPRSGHARAFPISGDAAYGLLGGPGALAVATTQTRLVALDSNGGVLWTSPMSHATSISQMTPIANGLLFLQPVSERGTSSPHLVALGRNDGKSMWELPVSPSLYSATLARLGPNPIMWSTSGGSIHWSVLDETDGKTIAQGDESGTRLVVRGRKFFVCDERQNIVRVHANITDTATQVVAEGRCSEMAIDDDTIYAIRSHREKQPDEVEAIRITDGTRRWLQKVPASQGALVHGEWLLVPSDGGVVRALRRDTGAIVWVNGVGDRGALSAFDSDTVIAAANGKITALRTTSTLPPERTSEITIHVTSWGCIDKENAEIFIGDIQAQSDGADRFTAHVRGRGRVAARVKPWGDLVPVRTSTNDESRDWTYGPLLVDIDGMRHSVDATIDECDED